MKFSEFHAGQTLVAGPASLTDPSWTICRAVHKRWGRTEAVAAALLRYDRAGGRRLAGLTRRRQDERRLWLNGRYS